jgi:hypothetical protein
MGEREGDDPLLDHLGQGVRHLRPPALARAQHLEAVALDLTLPAVVGRAVDAEGPTGLGDRRAGGVGKDLLAVAEQGVIIGHAARSFCTWR